MGDDLTSLHVRQAISGKEASRNWIVQHFSPALLVQARYRLQGRRLPGCDVEDLVAEAWMVALPRLPQLTARDGRWTPVLVKFLSTTLIHRLHKVLRGFLRGEVREGSASGSPLSRVADSATSIPGKLVKQEVWDEVRAAIDRLSEADREVLVLRGIEQVPLQEVAETLGEKPNTISKRFARALEHLRAALPASVFAELRETS